MINKLEQCFYIALTHQNKLRKVFYKFLGNVNFFITYTRFNNFFKSIECKLIWKLLKHPGWFNILRQQNLYQTTLKKTLIRYLKGTTGKIMEKSWKRIVGILTWWTPPVVTKVHMSEPRKWLHAASPQITLTTVKM